MKGLVRLEFDFLKRGWAIEASTSGEAESVAESEFGFPVGV